MTSQNKATKQAPTKKEQQKNAARKPQEPQKIAPKVKPTESGKPLWDKPHSS